jgi:hypothetical protein
MNEDFDLPPETMEERYRLFSQVVSDLRTCQAMLPTDDYHLWDALLNTLLAEAELRCCCAHAVGEIRSMKR